MCGIAGFIDQRLSVSEKKETIQSMLGAIAHRGTDHSDHVIISDVCLGHNRLSIIDLSEHANQPYVFGNYHLVFNGELYNYIEIREELVALGYTFDTDSDTEVLIKAYDAFGTQCVEKFMGMWAFALYDAMKQTLFCSRDRFGIKPFYYMLEGGKFYFASEIKALKQLSGFNPEINMDHVQRFLSLGLVVYKEETFFKQVKCLLPATNLNWTKGQIETSTYWELTSAEASNPPYETAKDKFFSLFKRSVEQHLRSDVKTGACLSGGIDSSSLVSMMSRFFPFEFDAYNVFYDGKGETDERKWVHDVLDTYSNVKPHYITPSDAEIQEAIEKIIGFQDGPIPSSGIMSQYFLFQKAKNENVKVMIDGQGADEYLAGYHNFYPYFFSWLLQKLKIGTYFGEIRMFAKSQDFGFKKTLMLHLTAFKNLFVPFEKSKRLILDRQEEYTNSGNKVRFSFFGVKGRRNRTDDFFFQHIHLLILPNLLHYEDRNSMAFTIESRLPFLDHRLVEYAFSLPFDHKIKHGLTKFILRDSMKGTTPDSILERTDKKGFTTPGEVKWLRGPLKHLLEKENLQYLSAVCNMPKVEKLVAEFQAGSNKNASMVWRLAMLNTWLKVERL